MASIYESAGPQIGLTGSQTAPSFQPGRAYDPSQIMLQQSERDLTAFAQFSETLNKFLGDRAEEDKKKKIAVGFTKFVNGEFQLKPEVIQKEQAEVGQLKAAAISATQTANAAQTLPGAEGMAAHIRDTSPALQGWEAYGAAIAAAQSAPVSLSNYINQARAENRAIIDPTTGDTIHIRANMGRVEAQRAMEVLTGQWGVATGYNRINPTIMMEHANGNIAIAKARLMEAWGKELDLETQELTRIRVEGEQLKLWKGVNSPENAQQAINTFEKTSIVRTEQRNKEYASGFTKTIDGLLAERNFSGAYNTLNFLGNAIHPSGGLMKDHPSLQETFRTLEEKVGKAGTEFSGSIVKERLEKLTLEAKQADKLPLAARQAAYDDPKTGIIKRARDAGIVEEDINTLKSGGSEPYEIALLKGADEGTLFRGKSRITKAWVDSAERDKKIDKAVADKLRSYPGLPDEKQTVEELYKPAKAHASGLVGQWQDSMFTTGDIPTSTQQKQAARTRDAAVTAAMSKFGPTIQRLLESGQSPNPIEIGEQLAALARVELDNENNPYYWNPVTKSAPNINKLLETAPDLNKTFETVLPNNILDAITKRVSGLQIVGPASSLGMSAGLIQAEQESVNSGGPISLSVRNAAKYAGYTDVNKYLSDQATNQGLTWTPNKSQQTYLDGVRKVSPAIAKQLASDLTPSARRSWISKLRALEAAQQLGPQSTSIVPGSGLSSLQKDIVIGESGGDYGQYNFGVVRSGPGNTAIQALTVRDVVRGDYRINGQLVKHYGAYQFKPATFAIAAKAAGIPDNAPFNQDTQDRAFQAVVANGAIPQRTSLNDYVAGRIPDTEGNLTAAITDLRSEWTSVRNMTPVKLGQYLRSVRMEKAVPPAPTLSTMAAPARTVEVGKTLLGMGAKIWQHPDFDLRKGYSPKGGVVGTNRSSRSLHHQAQALDLPRSDNTVVALDNIYDYLIKNAKALGISEVYWDRKGYYRGGKMIGGPRSNAVPGHDTHLHVSFE
jgi:hypothetical protein